MQVYNLPETVRESDVEKLSFAVELADAFFSDSSQVGCVCKRLFCHQLFWLLISQYC